jgi:hypothetical protein
MSKHDAIKMVLGILGDQPGPFVIKPGKQADFEVEYVPTASVFAKFALADVMLALSTRDQLNRTSGLAGVVA